MIYALPKTNSPTELQPIPEYENSPDFASKPAADLSLIKPDFHNSPAGRRHFPRPRGTRRLEEEEVVRAHLHLC